MLDAPLNFPTLTGIESTAKIFKNWLVDEKNLALDWLGLTMLAKSSQQERFNMA